MKRPRRRFARLALFLPLAGLAAPAVFAQERLSLEAALRQSYATYPTITGRELALRRAQQEFAKVESQLGWVLTGRGGLSRDPTQFSATVDRAEIAGGVSRRLASGDTLGFGAGLLHEDSAFNFGPTVPNPVGTASADVSYRRPLLRGAGNTAYHQGLAAAQAGTDQAEAELDDSYDRLAAQVVQNFFLASATRARLDNAESSIQRALRLQEYIRGNLRLGLSEKKDVIQAEAQLRAREADRDALLVTWQALRTVLNRLLGRPPERELVTLHDEGSRPTSDSLPLLTERALAYSPLLRQLRARVDLATAQIDLRRDTLSDQLDLVFSLGERLRDGDVPPGGSFDDNDTVGGARVEYQRALDRRGIDAELLQAHLDRDILRTDLKLRSDDLRYEVARLAREISASEQALAQYRRHREAEQAKLEEATGRYRAGRTETDRLIQFEGDLYDAELRARTEAVNLSRRRAELELLLGRFAPGALKPAGEGQR
jgi:outer membrane protein TolC